MKKLQTLVLVIATLMLLPAVGRTASVDPGVGYTNDFSVQPLAADWSTFTRPGQSPDNYIFESDVNSNVTASATTARTLADGQTPAFQNALATWSSNAFYLQTRPTGNRYTALMGTFVNNTGTNATQLALSYLFSITGTGVSEESTNGTRVYYSLTGTTSSWINLPTLNTIASAASSTVVSTNLSLNWSNGATLYLLWVDDNASGQGTDSGDQIDNFSLSVTAGLPLSFAIALSAPTNNAFLVSGNNVTAQTLVANGTAPFTVEYFTNSGLGNAIFASAGSSTSAPYPVNLGSLSAGTYNIYAVATDSTGVPAVTNSVTNTFTIADPLTPVLIAPADNATFDSSTDVTGTATVSGGTGPYSVQFYLDNVANGAPVTSLPYAHDFGTLFVGDHSIRVTVTDARGWVSNSVAHVVHVTGPLGAILTPTNGSGFLYGESITLTATVGGGSSPYIATFFVNNVMEDTDDTVPFTVGLGVLPVGSYTAYVHVADGTFPAQESFSSTNIISILPNPVVVSLVTPTNGQSAASGTPFAVAATASVGAPLTVTNVEFFVDGVSIGADGSVPFTASATNLAPGNHTFFAVARDNLGQTAYSATNQVLFLVDPLANDHFANRFVLTGPVVTVTGSSVGATTEPGEPLGTGFNSHAATLWWTWTAPATGTVGIDTFGSGFNTVLGVYTGAVVSALTQVAFNNNAPGFQDVSLVSFNAIQGTVYQIQVGGAPFAFINGVLLYATGPLRLNLLMPPSVIITSPTNGNVFYTGSNYLITATASSPNAAVTQVEFYRGGQLLGLSLAEPYSLLVINAPAGTNSLVAVVRDSLGLSATSAVVNVLVANIGLTLTSPADGSLFGNTNPITVAAFAQLPIGAITNVEFFVNGVRFASDSTVPFSGGWSNVTSGSHRLTAVGRSDAGTVYQSQAVNIGVATTVLPFGAVWNYLDNGSDQGTAWRAPGFDDSSWTNGPAELGYGDGDEATVVQDNGTPGYTPTDTDRYITTYFRKTFVVTNLTLFTDLVLALERDDSGVVYLNGVEVLRSPNLPPPPTPILYSTPATGQGLEEIIDIVFLSASSLVDGTNTLAVEIHQQAPESSDITFNLTLLGLPAIIRNESPLISISSPTNDVFFRAPASIDIAATASDPDGTVSKVEFFFDDIKIGETTNSPYMFAWTNPPIGAHVLTAIVTDNQAATTASAAVPIVVYDADGTPVARITLPLSGTVVEGPTNVLLGATANATTSVTNVEFLVDGVAVGSDDTAPYSAIWATMFGTHNIAAVAIDANGVRGTSAPVSIVITIPPTNVVAPFILRQVPIAGSTVTNLTNITIFFSERVQGVNASDLLVGGVPATGLTALAGGSNYTFRFQQPPYGAVDVLIATGHGITDFGFPAPLPYDDLGIDAKWNYVLEDKTRPVIFSRNPAANTTVTNLTQVVVNFSEPVSGVNAADLIVGGSPAFALAGSGTNYTFSVSQPPSGTVFVSWAAGHGITDQAAVPNAFVAANWNFTLDARTILVQSNATWKFIKGQAEASTPVEAWRQLGFDDSSWSNAPAPFFYGDPYSNNVPAFTHLTDMRSNYTGIFLRQEFTVANASAITNLLLGAQSDDGFIAWLNGVEVARYNVAPGPVAYNGVASITANEPGQNGVPIVVTTLTNAAAQLVSGINVLAIHALNDNLSSSSDFAFNAQLFTYLSNAGLTAPSLVQAIPVSGDLLALTNITVTFSEGVGGVNASDLLVNGVPATGLSSTTNTVYEFSFVQPSYGPVVVNWATNHDIVDFDVVSKPFNALAANATLLYTLINPSNPRVLSQIPAFSSTVTGLTSITVTFTEPVTGVNAADLLIDGIPATTLFAASSDYTFSFQQPAFGPVTVRWATNHGIQDLEVPGNDFDPTRFGGQWDYLLVDPRPSVAITSPANGTAVMAPANFTLRANATDNDGTVSLVEFFVNGSKLGDTTNAPYQFDWTNVLAGVYSIRALATDNLGLSRTSAPVSVTVVTGAPIALVRGPYLQIGTPSSGLVRWRTDVASDAVVAYGTDPSALTNVATQAVVTNEHIVEVGNLQADTRYYYSIGSSEQILVTGEDYWFVTSPLPGTKKPTRLWVLGDAGTAGNGSPDRQASTRDAFYAFAANSGRPADIWLMLGDNAYNSGTDEEHQRAIFEMYPTTLRNLFLWPTIGNHETSQSTTANSFPYLDIFSLPQNAEAGGVASGTEKYYSFDRANIHFVCLDSMTSGRTADTAMAQWLRDDLAATSQDWIIVFFHHPPYTKGSHNSDAESDLVQIRQNLVPILESYGVDLVLSGHSHCWERSFLLHGHYGMSTTISASMKLDGGDGREDGDGAYQKNDQGEGVVYTVAGSSGQATGGQLNHPAHFISLNDLGSMVIDVSADRLDGYFLHANGTTPDHFTLVKPVIDIVPNAPLHLLAGLDAANHIVLAWSDPATNESGVLIERSSNGVEFVSLGELPADTTMHVDSNVLANITYSYRVRTTNTAGLSDYSNIASVSTVLATSDPAAPTDLVARADNGVEFYRHQIILRWRDRSSNEAGFMIDRANDGGLFEPITTLAANATAFIDRGLDSASVYTYRLRSFNALNESLSSNLAGEMTHPQSDILFAGNTAIFHAGVEGTPPITYQWRYFGVTLAGETNQTLTIENVGVIDEGAYSVVINDVTGVLVSNPAWLFVLGPPHIAGQPVSRTNLVGTTATFVVDADSGGLLGYQWRRNGIPLPGATDPQLTIVNVQLSDQGDYDVVVENEFGSATSAVAVLVVHTPPVAGPDVVYRFDNEPVAIDLAILLANDSDADGEAFSITSVATNSAHGATISMLGRYLLYTTPAGVTNDTFLYILTDARGATGIGVVTVVLSDNTPPSIVPVPNIMAEVLAALTFTNQAVDAGTPAHALTHALVEGAPANARINAGSGLFTWIPTREQARSTNTISVLVADNGLPSLTDTQTFTVVVNDYAEISLGSAVVDAGQNGQVPIDLVSSTALSALHFQLNYESARLTNLTVEPLAPQLASVSLQPSNAGSARLSFTSLPGQTLQGTQQLARLHFLAVPGQVSGFTPLEISDMGTTRGGVGATPTALVNEGRVAIIGEQPLLEGLSGASRQLIFYGKPGHSYVLESTSTPADPASWTPVGQLTLTDVSQVVPILPSVTSSIFYRVRAL